MIETKFKQTEIGLIPEEWEVFSVGKDCIVKARIGWQGLTTFEYLETGEYALITSTDIIDGSIDWRTCHFVSKFRYEQDVKIQVQENDILISKDGTIGKVGIVRNQPFPATLNSGVFVIRAKDNQNQKGFSLAFVSEYFREFINRLTAGSTIVHLYQKDIVHFKFPLPIDIQEQQRIATALSDTDALISALNKKIEKKKLIKQGTMQQLLTGQKRLHGFSEPWVEKRLGETCSIYRGGSPRPIESYITNDVNGINWIKIGDVEPGSKYIIKTAEKIKLEGESKSRKVYAGDFILSNSMSFGRPFILKIDGCIHDGWLVIQNYQEYFDLDYLYYLLGSEYVFEQYRKMAAGSSVQNLNKDKVSNVLVRMSLSKTEQTAIAEILSDMDKEIAELESKRTKYERIKQGMMQQLLTGKIRLTD